MGCRVGACVRIVGYIARLIIYMCIYVDLIWSDSLRVVEYKFVYRDFYFVQVHIRELEKEVKLLKNLSHPNIVVSSLC